MPEQISSYRLEEEIARGGMGTVYRGVHTVFDEVVAIKAIFPELTLNPVLCERFLNEAKIQRRLQHPNIVQIREFLNDQGKFYIVMEFIEGETLAHRLLELGRPMVASEAIAIFCQALEGLGFAHSQGVIHRDIKPSNIMLTRAGIAKLTDFGIARALGSAKLTTTGTALGTPAYMAPEQIQGKKLDRRSDIYSMGIMLYEMLTGRVPFQAPADSESGFSVLAAHISHTPTPPSHWVPDIPLFLEAAILKALEKRRENRFASCQEFQAALSRTGDREGAMAEYRESLRPNPRNEGAHVSLAIQLSQTGDWDGAIAEYTELVRLSPYDHGAHYSLGMAYEHKGNRQAALQEYRTACDLNPNIPAYKQAYERLWQQGYR